MIFKTVKLVLISAAVIAIAGGVLFGRDLYSYISSSARAMQASVKDAVPMEFELRRARDLLDDIIPEMQANVRLIAQQEVEIEDLGADIGQSRERLTSQVAQIDGLRQAMKTSNVSFTIGQINYTRDQLMEDLAQRLGHVKEADLILAGKQRLLTNRQKALTAAMQALDRTRSQKTLLEGQIASLEAQHKLVRMASVGSDIQIDNSKLAQTERLISQIKRQLDVAERVLAHEARFTQPIMIESMNESELMAQTDEYLASRQ